jgi:hypothetical protein
MWLVFKELENHLVAGKPTHQVSKVLCERVEKRCVLQAKKSEGRMSKV